MQFVVTGLSLGGHITWDILAQDPRVTNAIIIVGSPNLTNMLEERLQQYISTSSASTDSKTSTDSKEWPKSIQKLYTARDKHLESIMGKKILILNGAIDALVPSRFTRPWVERYAANNDVTFIEQEDNGHWLSYQMMGHVVDWILQSLT